MGSGFKVFEEAASGTVLPLRQHGNRIEGTEGEERLLAEQKTNSGRVRGAEAPPRGRGDLRVRGFGWVGSCFHVVLLVLHRRLDTSKPRPECRVVWWRGRRGQDALKPPNSWGATFRGWARGTQPECWFRQGSRARRQTHNPLQLHLALGALCTFPPHLSPADVDNALHLLHHHGLVLGRFLHWGTRRTFGERKGKRPRRRE